MKHLILAAAALLGVCAAARANLGDTLPKADNRYGAPSETKQDATGVITNLYVHDGIGIVVRFLDAKSQSESYIKGRQAEFSGEEIAALLQANAMGSDWRSVYKNARVQRWELKSRDATAVYSRTNHTLIFSTKEFIRSADKIKLIDSD